MEKTGHVYSPNSVIEAIDGREFGNYWSGTETYESLLTYIAMYFGGLRQLIVDMLGSLRCNIDVESFQNDITSFRSADDVVTLLIHMGDLAYDNKSKEAFIPNEEVRSAFFRAVKNDGWNEVMRAINASEALLKATLAMDERAVEQMIQDVHMKNSSSLLYNFRSFVFILFTLGRDRQKRCLTVLIICRKRWSNWKKPTIIKLFC